MLSISSEASSGGNSSDRDTESPEGPETAIIGDTALLGLGTVVERSNEESGTAGVEDSATADGSLLAEGSGRCSTFDCWQCGQIQSRDLRS